MKIIKFGYSGYPPFVDRGATPSGLCIDLVVSSIKAFNGNASSVECYWHDWQQKLQEGTIDVYCNPAFPSLGRTFYYIPIIQIGTLKCIFTKKLYPAFNNIVEGIKGILNRMAKAHLSHQNDIVHQLEVDLRDHLANLADNSSGLAVVKGFTDEYTLDLLRVPIAKRIESEGYIEKLSQLCNEGYIIVSDEFTVREVENKVTNTPIYIADLLGSDFHSSLPAGFALRHEDKELISSLKEQFLDESSSFNKVIETHLHSLNMDQNVVISRMDSLTLINSERSFDWKVSCGINFSSPLRGVKVFINYAREDNTKVKRIYRELKKIGLLPFLDAHDLQAGQYWKNEIYNQIENSDFVLLCLSNQSTTKKGFVQNEIRHALEIAKNIPFGKAFVIPVKLEDCELPRELSDIQTIEIFKRGGMDKLVKSIYFHELQK